MTALRNPDTGSIIQASGGLEQRLRDKGWEPTDQPPAPGLRLVTAADLDQKAIQLDQLQATVQVALAASQDDRAGLHAALTASQADRANLRQMLEPLAEQVPEVVTEVDALTRTIEAPTVAAAPKPTPRTDALEAWQAAAEVALDDIQATVTAIDVPAAVNAWVTANPPPAGPPGDDGAPGKDAYELARDAGYGGTRTQWLASLKGETGQQGPAGPASTVAGPQGPPGADSTVPGPKGDVGNTGPPGTTDYTQLLNKPTLGSAASKDTGTGATQVVLGNDARLTDARTPTAHTHPAAQVTGLHAVATTGAYADLSGKPALSFDPAGSAAAAQAAAVQRANHTGSQPAASITGLHAVATSGDYNALANKPAIPAAVVARRVVQNTAALTANTVKAVAVSFSPAMPDTNYAVTATVESNTPQNVSIGVTNKTTTGCTLQVRSTVAVAAAGLNVSVIALA